MLALALRAAPCTVRELQYCVHWILQRLHLQYVFVYD